MPFGRSARRTCTDRVVGVGVEDPVVALRRSSCSRPSGSRARGRRRGSARNRAWPALHTPVTSAPSVLAIWTANGPTLPDAPSMRTLSPGWTVRPSRRRSPWMREDRRVREGRGILEGQRGRDLQRTPSPARRRTRRMPPARTRTRPRRPGHPPGTRVTPAPTDSTTPATSIPIRGSRGARMPIIGRMNPGRGPR